MWLECSLETALARTVASFAPRVVRAQFERYATRYKPALERIVRTDLLSIEEAADAVQDLLPARPYQEFPD